MSILLDEMLLPIPRAIEQVTGDRMSYPTCFRWSQRGLLARDGTRVRLQFVKCGNRRKTSVQAVRRFLASLNADSRAEPTLSAGRRKAIAAAEAHLDSSDGVSPEIHRRE